MGGCGGRGTTGEHPSGPQALAVPFLCQSKVWEPSHPIIKGMGVHFFKEFFFFSHVLAGPFSLSSTGTRDCIHRICRKGMSSTPLPLCTGSTFLCLPQVQGVIPSNQEGMSVLFSVSCVGSTVSLLSPSARGCNPSLETGWGG